MILQALEAGAAEEYRLGLRPSFDDHTLYFGSNSSFYLDVVISISSNSILINY